MSANFKKLNMACIIIAIALFFLPWTVFSCSGTEIFSQSGVQSLTGDVSLSDAMQAFTETTSKFGGETDAAIGTTAKSESLEKFKQEAEYPYLMPLVALLVVAALVASVFSIVRKNDRGKLFAVLSGAAVVVLLAQTLIGFAINGAVTKYHKDIAEKNDKSTVMFAAALNVKTVYTPWFFLEFAALGLPGLLFLTGAGRPKRSYRPKTRTRGRAPLPQGVRPPAAMVRPNASSAAGPIACAASPQPEAMDLPDDRATRDQT